MGLLFPTVAAGLLLNVGISALLLVLARRFLACANRPVLRVLHGITLVLALAALVFVAVASFLIYSREPALAASWRLTARDDPAAICKYEARRTAAAFAMCRVSARSAPTATGVIVRQSGPRGTKMQRKLR